jgi:hypothetical protein
MSGKRFIKTSLHISTPTYLHYSENHKYHWRDRQRSPSSPEGVPFSLTFSATPQTPSNLLPIFLRGAPKPPVNQVPKFRFLQIHDISIVENCSLIHGFESADLGKFEVEEVCTSSTSQHFYLQLDKDRGVAINERN